MLLWRAIYSLGILAIKKMKREEYLCNSLVIANAVVAHMCGYPKVLEKVQKKHSVHNTKRKVEKRVLIRKNANNYVHMQPT